MSYFGHNLLDDNSILVIELQISPNITMQIKGKPFDEVFSKHTEFWVFSPCCKHTLSICKTIYRGLNRNFNQEVIPLQLGDILIEINKR